MSIDLYYVPGSSPCRAVRLVAAAIGLDLNLKLTDLMTGQHLTPEFIKVSYFACLEVAILYQWLLNNNVGSLLTDESTAHAANSG